MLFWYLLCKSCDISEAQKHRRRQKSGAFMSYQVIRDPRKGRRERSTGPFFNNRCRHVGRLPLSNFSQPQQNQQMKLARLQKQAKTFYHDEEWIWQTVTGMKSLKTTRLGERKFSSKLFYSVRALTRRSLSISSPFRLEIVIWYIFHC